VTTLEIPSLAPDESNLSPADSLGIIKKLLVSAMNIEKMKKLIKDNGDKFIFMEGDEPDVVMMSFKEYEKILNHTNGQTTYSGKQRINHIYPSPDKKMETDENMILEKDTEFIIPRDLESTSLPIRLEDIRLEDLPL